MKKTIKSKTEVKNTLYKKHIQDGIFEIELVFLENLITELNELISSSFVLWKPFEKFIYWSLLKTFYSDKKIQLIPTLLVDNKFLPDMKTKANIFNDLFAVQCTHLKNNNVLPINQKLLTQSRLVSLDLNEDEILKIIRRALNIQI